MIWFFSKKHSWYKGEWYWLGERIPDSIVCKNNFSDIRFVVVSDFSLFHLLLYFLQKKQREYMDYSFVMISFKETYHYYNCNLKKEKKKEKEKKKRFCCCFILCFVVVFLFTSVAVLLFHCCVLVVCFNIVVGYYMYMINMKINIMIKKKRKEKHCRVFWLCVCVFCDACL